MYEIQKRTNKGWENAWINHAKLARYYENSHSAFTALKTLIIEQNYAILLGNRKRRYLGRYFAHPMMQNRRAKRDDYKPSAVRVTQRCVP
ncbi:hypothetical protein PsalN5692_00029 [Piscirickettsia salmonis]|uniref:hypothetical protein n=1 Tax=Piscirickettsia salmonis TaxID=1238 RepID=UPI0012B8873F|nr:hypothetical protein [Piscirickettsia salmonis]QGP48631.1 hypothetical protein PsalN5692_00029 [Piscirickettsia salmonis]